jgi:hypothetical protein
VALASYEAARNTRGRAASGVGSGWPKMWLLLVETIAPDLTTTGSCRARNESQGGGAGTPARAQTRSESHPLSIINDQTASAGDRLRAMEQLESRALGKPKEHIETSTSAVDEYEKALRSLTPEERRQLMRGVEPN